MEHLTASLQTLGLNEVPQLANLATFPTYNQVDIYRAHIAELLAPITGVAAETVYPLLQWTQVLEYGDVMLPVPALRIKGKKPDALAVEIKEQVPLGRPTLSLLIILTLSVVPRVTPRPSSRRRKDLCPFLLQARPSRQARPSLNPQEQHQVRFQPQPRSQGPQGSQLRQEEDDCRVLIAQHCQAFPRRSLAFNHHWRFLEQPVRGCWLGRHSHELPR